MANTYAERFTRLGTKLDNIEARIADLSTQRDAIYAELNSIVGGGSVATKTTTVTTGKQRGRPSLGDRIVRFLTDNPNSNLATIATKMKVAGNQAALSLYHLSQKGIVTGDETAGTYTLTTASAPALKLNIDGTPMTQ
jgi:hypothetical protein